MADHLTPDGAQNLERSNRDVPSLHLPEELAPAQDDQFELTGRPVTEVHQWLDGEASEAEARRADARETALWAKISDETERRGRMTTPAPVLDRLMQAIPAQPAAEPSEGVLGKVKKLFGK
jgi:hypothetical protein